MDLAAWKGESLSVTIYKPLPQRMKNSMMTTKGLERLKTWAHIQGNGFVYK